MRPNEALGVGARADLWGVAEAVPEALVVMVQNAMVTDARYSIRDT